jgi:hypothetical protein
MAIWTWNQVTNMMNVNAVRLCKIVVQSSQLVIGSWTVCGLFGAVKLVTTASMVGPALACLVWSGDSPKPYVATDNADCLSCVVSVAMWKTLLNAAVHLEAMWKAAAPRPYTETAWLLAADCPVAVPWVAVAAAAVGTVALVRATSSRRLCPSYLEEQALPPHPGQHPRGGLQSRGCLYCVD